MRMSEANEPIKIPNMMPKEIVAHLDKYIIGQDEGQEEHRHCDPQPLSAQPLAEGDAGGDLAEQHHHGWADRRRQDRDRTPRQQDPWHTVCQGGSDKIHRGRLRRRDVESMVRDLVEASIRLVRAEKIKAVQGEAQKLATERLIDILVPSKKKQRSGNNPFEMLFGAQQQSDSAADAEEERRRNDQKVIFKEKLRRHEFDDQVIEIEVEEKRMTNDMLSATGMDQVMDNMNDMMKNIMPAKKKKKRVTVTEARDILAEEEAEKLIDEDLVAQEAIALAENHGIIFIDEIDKIAETNVNGGGAGVSREGVQRDILPIVEGSVVKTKYGPIKTDHILFIAAGAFHVSKPEDLIPELQGRFPYKVQLHSLDKHDFVRIPHRDRAFTAGKIRSLTGC